MSQNSALPQQAGPVAYFNGDFVPLAEANVNIMTHGLQYGTGCFGGMRGYYNDTTDNVYLFRPLDHFLRLKNSGKILQMALPKSPAELVEITCELIRRNQWKRNVYIRPFLYKKDLSLSPRVRETSDGFAIYTLALDDYLDVNKGLRTMVSSWQRIADNTIPTLSKATGGYINSALAKSEALGYGLDEAIFLNSAGNVAEGTAENIFIVRHGKLITPDLSQSILEGITRRTIIELAERELGLEVVERAIPRSELYVADEAFFCGTGVQAAWIGEIDGRLIGGGEIGPITRAIQEKYFETVRGRNPKYFHWNLGVY